MSRTAAIAAQSEPMPDPFAKASPRLFTLPGSVDGLRAITAGLAGMLRGRIAEGDAPFALADATVFVPTRRAVRGLREAFLDRAGDDPRATLLPSIRALGDIEPDGDPFEPCELALEIPPATPPYGRLFDLAGLVARKRKASGRPPNALADLTVAEEVARLLDEIGEHGPVDLSGLEARIADLPAHLQDAGAFLEILTVAWPQLLAATGRLDPGTRRDLLLRALAARWAETPPEAPVVIAGSTGAAPATAALIGVVSRLPRGLVILPGLDLDLDERGWDAIDDTHPQGALARLLVAIGATRADVSPWPGAVEPPAGRFRRRVLEEALRPAQATADWLARIAELRAGPEADPAVNPIADPIAGGLAGLTVVEAPSADAEARAIAAAVRRACEDPRKTALIVTPDRTIVRRVAATLDRFGLDLDASVGQPVHESVPGALLLQLLDLARDTGDPLQLATVLKSPLTTLGRARGSVRATAGELERAVLRGVRPGADLAAVIHAAGAHAGLGAAARLLGDLAAALAPLLADPELQPPDIHARNLVIAAEAVAETPERPGAERLWVGPAGEAAAELLRSLIVEGGAGAPMTLDVFSRVFARFAAKTSVRPPGRPQRVRALPPREARLQTADLVILAGLNEGTWPSPPAEDPFLSPGMRVAIGLPPAERRIGLSAHDFAQAAAAPQVILTRARRVDGAPTVASRWLWRLSTLARGAGVPLTGSAEARELEDALPAIDQRIDAAGAGPARRPAPTPPVAARPTRLSVTEIKTWVRDPYAIYAKHVLKLRVLDPLGRRPDAREWGVAIHAAMEALAGASAQDLDTGREGLVRRLVALIENRMIEAGYDLAERAERLPRAERAMRWAVGWHAGRIAKGWRVTGIETEADWTVGRAPAFTLRGRADRIEAGPGGALVLDFKTGNVPSRKQVDTGLDPQLPLLGAMLLAGVFPAQSRPADALTLGFAPVKGAGDLPDTDESGDFAGVLTVGDRAAAEIAAGRLARLVAAFADPRRAYLARARPQFMREEGDYDRLARTKEWLPHDDADAAGGADG